MIINQIIKQITKKRPEVTKKCKIQLFFIYFFGNFSINANCEIINDDYQLILKKIVLKT